MRLYALRIGGIADYPDPGLGALDRQRLPMDQAMLELETRPADIDELGFDRNLVAEPRRQPEFCPRLRQRMPHKVIGLQILDLLHAERAFEQHRGRDVEKVEIAHVENNAGRVAVAPFYSGFADVAEHEMRRQRTDDRRRIEGRWIVNGR